MNASTLTKRQFKIFDKFYTERGTQYHITATVRYDDQCGNGHNSFSITGNIDRMERGAWRNDCGGCIHEEISKHFPKLAPLIKWHLCASDGPMYYIANTVYLAGNRDHNGRTGEGKERELDAARRVAVWPDATDAELMQEPDALKAALLARLPALMAEFRAAVESLEFIW